MPRSLFQQPQIAVSEIFEIGPSVDLMTDAQFQEYLNNVIEDSKPAYEEAQFIRRCKLPWSDPERWDCKFLALRNLKIVASINDGMLHREAAERFGVSRTMVGLIVAAFRKSGMEHKWFKHAA